MPKQIMSEQIKDKPEKVEPDYSLRPGGPIQRDENNSPLTIPQLIKKLRK